MLPFAESAPLAEGRTRAHHTRIRPLFIIPPAAILRDGALSGTFQSNGSRHKDMTITAEFSRRGFSARRRVAPLLSAGLGIPVCRDALSLRPLCMPASRPDVAQCLPRGLPAGRFREAGLYPVPRFICWFGALARG
jgi:hypothetical protein